MIKLKYNRPTTKTLGNTSVYLNSKYIGYFMPNRTKFSRIGEDYNFCSEVSYIDSFYAKSRKILIGVIEINIK